MILGNDQECEIKCQVVFDGIGIVYYDVMILGLEIQTVIDVLEC